MQGRVWWSITLGLFLLLELSYIALSQETPKGTLAQRRAALLQAARQGPAALPQLQAALQEDNPVIRRTAVRLLIELGPAARPALEAALANSDWLVRRAALTALCEPLTPEAFPYLKKAMSDSEPLVRLAAVQRLTALKPRTPEIQALLTQAQQDEAPAVRELAAVALWPFYKETKSVRDRKDWDHEIKVVQEIPLPLEGWRFKEDPKHEGHLQNWFAPDFNDSDWALIKIGEAWEKQGHPYDGVAWYRGTFTLPAPKPTCLAVELAFGAVDEAAWVWINGEYVGQHDIGPEGWDKPFTLDVTKELRWGEKNQITVRVYDSAYAGGIWKPVTLQVLQ